MTICDETAGIGACFHMGKRKNGLTKEGAGGQTDVQCKIVNSMDTICLYMQIFTNFSSKSLFGRPKISCLRRAVCPIQEKFRQLQSTYQ